MEKYRIDLVEQPVPVGDFEGLSLVTRTVPVTVEADEAAGSLADVYQLVTRRAVDAVSLKIPKLGGFRNTIAAARLCEQAGIAYRLGAAIGPRLLAAHALHLACALPGVTYACELGEFARLLDEVLRASTLSMGSCAFRKRPARACAGRRLERSRRIGTRDSAIGPTAAFFLGFAFYRDVQDFAAGADPDCRSCSSWSRRR